MYNRLNFINWEGYYFLIINFFFYENFVICIFNCNRFSHSLTSCTDEGILHDTDVTVINDKISTRGNGINRHYFDTGDPDGVPDIDFGCQAPPQSCFDDVVVTGQKLDVVNDIFNNIGSWTDGQLQNFVDTNSDDVEDIIGETETSGIISGTSFLLMSMIFCAVHLAVW